jgi:hypothetical protein
MAGFSTQTAWTCHNAKPHIFCHPDRPIHTLHSTSPHPLALPPPTHTQTPRTTLCPVCYPTCF